MPQYNTPQEVVTGLNRATAWFWSGTWRMGAAEENDTIVTVGPDGTILASFGRGRFIYNVSPRQGLTILGSPEASDVEVMRRLLQQLQG